MRIPKVWRTTALAVAVVIGGCSYDVEVGDATLDPDLTPTADYDGLREAPGLDWYELSQGWNSELRRAYWFTPQGSALVPYDWFLHLEMPERNCKGEPDPSLNPGDWTLFRDAGHMRSLGYIPAPSDPVWNPDGLPIGFAKSPTADGDFMGPTCSACHSNLMVLNGRKVLVEGAPTLADLQGLNVGLAKALCSMDPAKVRSKASNREAAMADAEAQFKRFAERVLEEGYTEEKAQALLKRVRKQTKKIQVRNARNYTKPFPPYGKGRLDALGAILNEVAVTAARAAVNSYPANAPVSYPFLWGTPQSDVVQWNGAVDNQSFGFGPLGRNVGEVVGVYGHVEVFLTEEGEEFEERLKLEEEQRRERALQRGEEEEVPVDQEPQGLTAPLVEMKRGAQLGGFESSVMVANLGSIERWISMLRSPKWPEDVLGRLDPAKVERGREIYMGKGAKRVKCVGCHRLVARADQDKAYQSTMVRVPDIGTDPAAANNFLLESRPRFQTPWITGRFEGMKKGVLSGDRYGKTFLYRGEALTTVVVGVILGDLFFDGLSGAYRSRSVSEATEVINPVDKLFRYKARPLTGIWATAPYLHNGSVASLAQLLTLEEDRDPTFCVGNREFDPQNVGFVSEMDGNGMCKDDQYKSTLLDTSGFGASNSGHSSDRQGVKLRPEDKEALIEFLKTL